MTKKVQSLRLRYIPGKQAVFFFHFMCFLPVQKCFGVKLKGLLKVRNPLGPSPLPLNSPLPQSLNNSSTVCYNIWPVRSSGWETNITAASFSSRFDDKWGCSLAALLTRLHSPCFIHGPPPCRRDCYADVCCLREEANTVMPRSSHIKSVSLTFLIIWAWLFWKTKCVKFNCIHCSRRRADKKPHTNPF